MPLRDYQLGGKTSVEVGWQHYDSLLVDWATGLGKTVLAAATVADRPGRTMHMVPLLSLIGQTCDKYHAFTHEWPAVEQAEQFSNEHPNCRSDYIVASKQTLSSICNGRPRYERIRDIGTLVVDEAHLWVTKSGTEIINHYLSHGAKVLCLTATPKRHDKRAMGQIADARVHTYGLKEAINDGWLVEPKILCRQLKSLDLSQVPTGASQYGKDFIQAQLAAQLERDRTIIETVDALGPTIGKKTAIYSASVAQAQAGSERTQDKLGIKSAWICADPKRCHKDTRREVLRSFMEDPNGITHIWNVGILTTGWDFPNLECIVMAQPTQSKPRYTQIMGRLCRVCEVDGRPVIEESTTPDSRKAAIASSSKPYGLVIDLVDCSLKHKLVTAVDVLGGSWGIPQKAAAMDFLDDEEEPKRAEEIQEKAFDEAERERRRLIASQAEFADREIDPFGRGSSSTRKLKKPIVPATDKQLAFLYRRGLRDIDSFEVSKGQAGRMIGQFMSGMSKRDILKVNTLKVR